MTRALTVKGRAWVLADGAGRLLENIDTDMIYHNAHLAVTEVAKMGAFALGNLDGYKEFAKECRPGDIVVAGANFGAGSSRQHAVDCFRALGVAALLVESAGSIYLRNAINSGFPLLRADGLSAALEAARRAGGELLATGDEVECDLAAGRVRNLTRGVDLPGVRPMSSVQLDIFRAGSLFDYGKQLA